MNTSNIILNNSKLYLWNKNSKKGIHARLFIPLTHVSKLTKILRLPVHFSFIYFGNETGLLVQIKMIKILKNNFIIGV